MRLIDADELIEHAWRDKLDSRELIAEMINNAPTIKEIPTTIPINVFEQLISLEPKTGHWINIEDRTDWYDATYKCSCCGRELMTPYDLKDNLYNDYPYCHCGCRMVEPQENEGE